MPQTVDEAVPFLLSSIDEKSKSLIKYTPREGLVGRFHFGWGMQIRNGLGLWGKNPALLADCARHSGTERIHPDEASSIIIEAVWNELQSQRLPKWLPPQPTVTVDSLLLLSSRERLDQTLLQQATNTLEARIEYPRIAELAGVEGQLAVELATRSDGEVGEATYIQNLEAGTEEYVTRAAQAGPLFSDSTRDLTSVIRAYISFKLVEQPPIWPDDAP